MAKALKIAGAVVAVAGLAIVTGGLAAGASLSFIMSAGIGAGSLTVGGLIAVSAALNTAGSLLSPKPKAPSTSEANANRLSVSMEVRAFRKTVVGSTAMATDLRDQEWSADQSLLHRFIVCASHRCQAIREIWFDDKLAWSVTGGVQAPYVGYLVVTPVLEGSAANAINIGARMGSTRRYTGLAYVYLRYKLTGNGKKAESPFAQSIPTRVTIVGDGALFYDPRLDSTVPGGSGSMRAADQRTWAWNANACRNPALGLLFFLLGWRIQNPATGEWKLAVGKGIPASRIDLPSFITAANLCDEPVTRADGTTEPRYRADGIYSEGDDPSLVLDNYKAAMNAVLDDADGKIRVTVLHNDLATPIGDLTTADVLGEFTWLQTPPLTDSVNIIRGGYTDPSPNSLYQLVDLPEVAIPSPDGIDRPQTVPLPFVQSPGQGQRLFKLRLGRAQYGGTYTAIFQATAWKYQKGDVVRFSFLPLGWDKKLFRIADVATQVDGTVPMMLREEHPDIYLAYSNEAAAIKSAAPTSYDASLWPVIQGIKDAGTTAEWPNVTGEGKPEDNATVGAPIGTNVGGRPVSDVIQQIDKARADIDGLIETVSEGQTDLSEQVNAANAARDASQTARDQSQAARDAAQSASTLSGAARDAAQTAKTAAESAASTAAQKATDAGGYASTSAGQATIATQKADAAGQSATNASASASTASTKAGEASTSAQTAVTAKNDAQGSATSAGSSAGVATQAKTDAQAAAKASSDSANSASSASSAAGQSATAAAGSATAAGTSAGQASTSAGQASTSASNAQGSANSAASSASVAATARDDSVAAANQSFPGFEKQSAFWGWDTPTGRNNGGVAWEPRHEKGAGISLQQALIGGSWFYMDPAAWLKAVPGKRYRATIYVWQWSAPNGYGGNPRVYWEGHNQDHTVGEYIPPSSGAPENTLGNYYSIPGAGWWLTGSELLLTEADTANANRFWVRPRINIDNIPVGSGYVIAGWKFTEVTSEALSKGYADASSTSASSAAASNSAAGASASAAEGSRQAAATAAGTATSARDTAVTSASNAQGSANAAASSATLSARTAQDGAAAAQNGNRSPGAARSLWTINEYNTFNPGSTLPATAAGSVSYTPSGDMISQGGAHIHPLKADRVDPTRRIRVIARYQQIPGGSNADTTDHTVYLACFDKDGAIMFGNVLFIGAGPATSVNGPERTAEFVLRPSDYSPAVAYIRPMYRSPSGVYTRVAQVYWLDDESRAQAADSASASVTSAAAAKTSQDAAGSSATAANQSRIDAQAANGAAQSAASAASSSAASADASRSQAQTSATLATSYNSLSAGVNDKFANWPDPAQYPQGWVNWAAGGNWRFDRWPGGVGSPYGIRTLNDAANAESGHFQQFPVFAGSWVMEATIQLTANTLNGSGLTVQGVWNLDFAREPDSRGVVSATDTSIRSYSKLFVIDQTNANRIGVYANFHCMHGWSGFGQVDPRYMIWYMARIRPATQPEIDAGKALVNASSNAARIESINRTLSDQYGSLAQRMSSTEATAGNLVSRTGINESAVADLRTKQAAARLELTAASPGGNAKMTLRSDSINGNAIDFGADNINFVGRLAIGLEGSGQRLKLTNKLIEFVDGNGDWTVQLGDWG